MTSPGKGGRREENRAVPRTSRRMVVMVALALICTAADARTRWKFWQRADATPYPYLIKVHTADNCRPCMDLRNAVTGLTIPIMTETRARIVDVYPVCQYDDGTTDTGQRIYSQACRYRPSTEFLKYKPRRKK